MKHKILFPLLLVFSAFKLRAQDNSRQNFEQAYQEITSMLEGKQALDFERAVFLTENAYRDNALNYEDFKSAIDVHSAIIEQFIKANDRYDWKQFVRGNRGIAPDMEVEAKEQYRKALANYAIFTYLTDTLTLHLNGQEFLHLPYTYSQQDPFGTADWKNSQAVHLLETQKGNCYSLVTLFKIFSERFKSEANIVTAPQHIYIEHRDPKGSRFNVEVATRSFPDFGSIQTLTYTTGDALHNDISMRELNLKQSIGLTLVYLAKGYEYKNKVKDDEFLLTCANTALKHDPKNLNALLLRAQVYEQQVMKGQMPAAPYEPILAELYTLGYRQMPDDMKEIILSKIQGRPSTVTPADKTQNTFAEIGEQARVATLSNGLFEEQHRPQKIVRYGQTIFDTEKGKVIKFLEEDISSYQVDPVVFALSVDPLTKGYPWNSPYAFAENDVIRSIDLEGAERSVKTYSYSISNGKAVQSVTNDVWVQKTDISIHPAGTPMTDKQIAAHSAITYQSNPKPENGTFVYFEFAPELNMANYAKYFYTDANGNVQTQYFSQADMQFRFSEIMEAKKKLDATFNIAASAANLVAAGWLVKAELSAVTQSINPSKIRFSQSSVNGAEEIIQRMKGNGWAGDPIDVVKMSDGGLTTIDNTRVLAASEAGIDVKAIVHDYNEVLPSNLVERFTTKAGTPKTWGEAVDLRLGKQKASYREKNPNGSNVTERKN